MAASFLCSTMGGRDIWALGGAETQPQLVSPGPPRKVTSWASWGWAQGEALSWGPGCLCDSAQ